MNNNNNNDYDKYYEVIKSLDNKFNTNNGILYNVVTLALSNKFPNTNFYDILKTLLKEKKISIIEVYDDLFGVNKFVKLLENNVEKQHKVIYTSNDNIYIPDIPVLEDVNPIYNNNDSEINYINDNKNNEDDEFDNNSENDIEFFEDNILTNGSSEYSNPKLIEKYKNSKGYEFSIYISHYFDFNKNNKNIFALKSNCDFKLENGNLIANNDLYHLKCNKSLITNCECKGQKYKDKCYHLNSCIIFCYKLYYIHFYVENIGKSLFVPLSIPNIKYTNESMRAFTKDIKIGVNTGTENILYILNNYLDNLYNPDLCIYNESIKTLRHNVKVLMNY